MVGRSIKVHVGYVKRTEANSTDNSALVIVTSVGVSALLLSIVVMVVAVVIMKRRKAAKQDISPARSGSEYASGKVFSFYMLISKMLLICNIIARNS